MIVQLLLSEGESLTDERYKILKKIIKEHKLYENEDYQSMDILIGIFQISKFQGQVLWGDDEQVSKGVFFDPKVIRTLSEILTINLITKYL